MKLNYFFSCNHFSWETWIWGKNTFNKLWLSFAKTALIRLEVDKAILFSSQVVVFIGPFSFLFCSFVPNGVCSQLTQLSLCDVIVFKKKSTGVEIECSHYVCEKNSSSPFVCFVPLTHCVIVSYTYFQTYSLQTVFVFFICFFRIVPVYL